MGRTPGIADTLVVTQQELILRSSVEEGLQRGHLSPHSEIGTSINRQFALTKTMKTTSVFVPNKANNHEHTKIHTLYNAFKNS